MKGPPGPPPSRFSRSLQADDSVETTMPDLDPRKTPRAPPPNVRAMALLDNEPTTVRIEPKHDAPRRDEAVRNAPAGDLFAELTPPRATESPPDPATLPIAPPRKQVVTAPASIAEMFATDDATLLKEDSTLESAPQRTHTLPPSSRLGLFAPPTRATPTPAPMQVAVPPPPSPVAQAVATPPPPPVQIVAPPSPPASVSFDSFSESEELPPPPAAPVPLAPLPPAIFATPEDDALDRSIALDVEGLPCTLRELLNQRKHNPNLKFVEDVAIHLTKCVRGLHEQGVVLGERLVPEHFTCNADLSVSFTEASAPPREIVEVYMAPELFRGRPPTVQSDIFAVAAITYEALVGRSAKPMFLPQVVQVSRVDTWFSDPGASMRDPYRFVLRQALAERPTRRHETMRVFAEELLRAWRLTHNPEVRRAEAAPADDQWKRLILPAAIIGVFVLLLLAMLLFPVDRIGAPAVPSVRPDMSQ